MTTADPPRSLLTLPVDEFTHIVRFVDTQGLARLAATCKA
jgi:hypothetical protein